MADKVDLSVQTQVPPPLPRNTQAPPPLRGRKRQGLRKLSPDLIRNAIDETNAQVSRIGLTFLGATAFCLLSLLSPDSALLGGSEKINVPAIWAGIPSSGSCCWVQRSS